MDYANPVLPGCHPDPTICRAGEDYFLATSSFEYFPGVPLYHSRNLVDWEPIGHCLTRDAQLPIRDIAASEGIYAPTLRHHAGTFYLVTTNVGAGGAFVVTAEDPRGEWSEPTWIDARGYDPDLFWADGETYLTYAADDAIHQRTVDLATGETGDERTVWHGLDGGYTEAPHLYAVDGTYYLLTAEGGTGSEHAVSVARSDDPTGPFEDHPDNPIFTHRSRVMQPISAAGHADLVRAHDGTWWATFLGIRKQGGHPPYHTLGRETFLAPVAWRDGWPAINDGEVATLEMSVGGTDLDADGDRAWTRTADPFADGTLGPEWNYRRNPDRERYAVDDGTLVLDGGPATLDGRRPTFVGRRQQHHDCRARCTLAFDPEDGEEAGLTALMNEDHHYEVAVRGRADGRRAIARRRIDGLAEVVGDRSLSDGPVALAIESHTTAEGGAEYRLFAGPADSVEVDSTDAGIERLATGDARYLSTEVATGFTGVYLGLYATGNGDECAASAHFREFEYGPLERETAPTSSPS